jgi:hypothetical protein
MIGDGDCGEIGGMKIGRGNYSMELLLRFTLEFMLLFLLLLII